MSHTDAPEVERQILSVDDYFAVAEQARVLARVVESDPEDTDAALVLSELRRNGFDIDAEYVLGLAPSNATCPDEVVGDRDASWVRRLMREASAFSAVGLNDRAIEHLDMALRLDPTNDVLRARVHALRAQRESSRPRRADDTVQITVPG